MEISSKEWLAPMVIEKIKILGAIFEIPAKQLCEFSLYTTKMGQIGLIGSAV